MSFIEAVTNFDVVTISGTIGDKWICVAANRSGATSFSITPNPIGSVWSVVHTEATLPTNDTARRTLAFAELSVQQNFTGVQFTAAFSTGDTSCIWIRVDSDYTLAEVVAADSGTSSVIAQSTGTTPSVGAGDVLIITGVASRGGWATRSWNTADIQPDTTELVAGQDDNEFSNACAAGYLELISQPSQTYTDQFNAGSSRLMTAGLVVWLNPASGDQNLNVGFHQQINSIFLPVISNQDAQNLSISFVPSGAQIFIHAIENQADDTLLVSFKASSSTIFQPTMNNEGDDVFEPILVGNGSLADQIMAGLIDQGFLFGSLADREYLRLLSKLALAYTGAQTLADLYELAGEVNRLSGLLETV